MKLYIMALESEEIAGKGRKSGLRVKKGIVGLH